MSMKMITYVCYISIFCLSYTSCYNINNNLLIHQKKKQVIISNNNNKYFHHHIIYLNNKIHSDDDDDSSKNYLNNNFKTRVKGSTSNKLLENARKLRQEVDDLEQQQQKSKQLSDEQQSQQLNNNINYNTSNKYVDDVDDSRYNTLITNDNKIDELVSSTSSLLSSSSSSIKDDFQRSDFFANEKVQPKIVIKQPINITVSTISSSGSEEDDTVNAFNPFKSLLTDNNTASSPSSLLVDRKDLNKGKLLADKISTDSSKRLTDSKRDTSKSSGSSSSSSSSWGKSNTPNAYKLVEKSRSEMSDETKRIIEKMSNSNSSNSYVYSDQSGDGSVNSKTLTKFLIENNMTFRDRLQMQFEKVKQAVVVVFVVADDYDDENDDDDDDVIDLNVVYDHNDYDLRCYIDDRNDDESNLDVYDPFIIVDSDDTCHVIIILYFPLVK